MIKSIGEKLLIFSLLIVGYTILLSLYLALAIILATILGYLIGETLNDPSIHMLFLDAFLVTLLIISIHKVPFKKLRANIVNFMKDRTRL